MKSITVWQPGILEYDRGLEWQERLATALQQGRLGESLILLQHHPVITLGRGGDWRDVLVSPALLERASISVRATDRGGRATYHGPGQLIAYPIMWVERERLCEYLNDLEHVAINLLAEYGIRAGRIEGHPGVWVAGQKIAAIGLAVQRGITRHGVALNVAPDMAHFRLILPCGLTHAEVTSMRQVLGCSPDLEAVAQRFAQHFAHVFGRFLETAQGEPPVDRWSDVESIPRAGGALRGA